MNQTFELPSLPRQGGSVAQMSLAVCEAIARPVAVLARIGCVRSTVISVLQQVPGHPWGAGHTIDLRLLADIRAARLSTMRVPGVSASTRTSAPAIHDTTSPMILTRSNLRDLGKHSIEAALTRTAGRVCGAGGAAALRGMKPTMLDSRITALGIE